VIEAAFGQLALVNGFVRREEQVQLALLLSDCIADGQAAAFEAPTGLGKSLAALVPALAHAYGGNKRVVISTYTNVLAEQYWWQDLPLASSLFEQEPPRCQLLMGRSRYACKAKMLEWESASTKSPSASTFGRTLSLSAFRLKSEQGIESEYLRINPRTSRKDRNTPSWQALSVPQVCTSRLCPHFKDCYYYGARRRAEDSSIIITNHSVVLQDALMKHINEDETGLLGCYDYLIVDEAHELRNAADATFEFELNASRLSMLESFSLGLEATVRRLILDPKDATQWEDRNSRFRRELSAIAVELKNLTLIESEPGILAVAPERMADHPRIKQGRIKDKARYASIAGDVSELCQEYLQFVQNFVRQYADHSEEMSRNYKEVQEITKNYGSHFHEVSLGAKRLLDPPEVSVSSWRVQGEEGSLRHDFVQPSALLQKLLWEKVPAAAISATLAIDSSFSYYCQSVGLKTTYEEVLPSPIAFAEMASLYLPKANAIPDPAEARKSNDEECYFHAVAIELAQIIRAVGGRTLALFHSRREMEAVANLVTPMIPDWRILVQKSSAAAALGEEFKRDESAILFGLKSFWNGFDVPGPTLSCVVIVRIPFDVPTDPLEIARAVWIQLEGEDPFQSQTLPKAKLAIKQGFGRLLRTTTDRGVVAILDPRISTKRYGEEILENLPRGLKRTHSMEEALSWAGVQPLAPSRP